MAQAGPASTIIAAAGRAVAGTTMTSARMSRVKTTCRSVAPRARTTRTADCRRRAMVAAIIPSAPTAAAAGPMSARIMAAWAVLRSAM